MWMINSSNSGYLYMKYYLHISSLVLLITSNVYYLWLVSNRWKENSESQWYWFTQQARPDTGLVPTHYVCNGYISHCFFYFRFCITNNQQTTWHQRNTGRFWRIKKNYPPIRVEVTLSAFWEKRTITKHMRYTEHLLRIKENYPPILEILSAFWEYRKITQQYMRNTERLLRIKTKYTTYAI